jgi:hypothetical protein
MATFRNVMLAGVSIIALASCGGGGSGQQSQSAASTSVASSDPSNTGAPSGTSASAAQFSVDAYVAGLAYDANRILTVQSIADGSSVRTQVGDPVETETADGADLIVCSQTKHSLQQNFDQVAILRPTAGIVWPGALVKANAALLDGTPEPITLARGATTLRVDLPGIGDHGTVLVQNPTGSSTQAAIDGALGWWNDNAYQEGYVNAASSSYLTSSAYSSEQAALDLGLHVSWASADVGTQFSAASSTEKSVAMMLFKQTFYTVTVDPPSSPAATLATSVNESAVKMQMTTEAPPAYVHSVAYGRIILFRMETTDAVSSADMKASLQYSAGVVPVEASLEAKYKSILAKSTVTAITIGGNAEAAVQIVTARNAGDLAPIITGKNAVYSKNNPGVPIAYTVRLLKDNAIAKMGYTTDYTANECRRASPAWITVRNSGGWYSARASVKYVDHATKQPVQINASNITIGTQRDFQVPAGATGVECWADEMWGFGWTNVFHQSWGALTNDVRFCLHGTTLSPGWNDCQ